MLIAATVAAAAAGYLTSSRAAPMYEAEVRLLVGPVNTDRDKLRAAGQLAQTYNAFVTSGPVLTATLEKLGKQAASLWGPTRTEVNSTTRIMKITVESTDATVAANTANALAESLIEYVSRSAPLEQGSTRVIDPARVPSRPASSLTRSRVPVAALAGFLVAFTIALLADGLGLGRRSRAAEGAERGLRRRQFTEL